MRLHLTDELREHEAGIMELGLIYTPDMAIPPQQKEFKLSGFCSRECTAVVSVSNGKYSYRSYSSFYFSHLQLLQGYPREGVTIFGSQLHTHGTGVRVVTKHVRDGVELPEINRDNHYSTHFQEIRPLRSPRKVLPVR